MPSYSDSSRTYQYQKPIIHSAHYTHSRESSSDSRTSYGSGSSGEYRSSSSRSSMGHHGGSYSGGERSEKKHRVPNNDDKSVKTASRGNVDVTNHKNRRYDASEPRSSYSTQAERHSNSSSSKKHREHTGSSRR